MFCISSIVVGIIDDMAYCCNAMLIAGIHDTVVWPSFSLGAIWLHSTSSCCLYHGL